MSAANLLGVKIKQKIKALSSYIYHIFKIFLSKAISVFTGNLVVLVTLLAIFTLPSLYMTYLTHFPPNVTTTDGIEVWIESSNWRHYVFWYFSVTGSVDIVWKILGPLLIALSAGKTFKEGMNMQSAIIFLWLLITYLNADYLFNLFTETNIHLVKNNTESLKNLGAPAKVLGNFYTSPLVKISGLIEYLNNLSSLVVTSIMIIIGISATSSSERV